MTLSTTITTATTELTITVEYDRRTGEATRIKKVFMNGINVTGMMVMHFENDLNKIIDGIDWREVARMELIEQ